MKKSVCFYYKFFIKNRKLVYFEDNEDEIFVQGLKKKEHLEFVDIIPDHDYHHHEDKHGWKIEVTKF